MAYAVARPNGRWELRESVLTPRGPRSRTLASFKTLSTEAIERAKRRATRPLSAEAIRETAVKAGAPVELAVADRAAADLIRELEAGRALDPTLRRLLLDALGGSSDRGPTASLDNARAAAAWIGASPADRGRALYDLLLLADAIPRKRAREPLRFPRLEASRA